MYMIRYMYKSFAIYFNTGITIEHNYCMHSYKIKDKKVNCIITHVVNAIKVYYCGDLLFLGSVAGAVMIGFSRSSDKDGGISVGALYAIGGSCL